MLVLTLIRDICHPDPAWLGHSQQGFLYSFLFLQVTQLQSTLMTVLVQKVPAQRSPTSFRNVSLTLHFIIATALYSLPSQPNLYVILYMKMKSKFAGNLKSRNCLLKPFTFLTTWERMGDTFRSSGMLRKRSNDMQLSGKITKM